jgi:hypothetical protein
MSRVVLGPRPEKSSTCGITGSKAGSLGFGSQGIGCKGLGFQFGFKGIVRLGVQIQM